MTKARDLADLISAGNPLADGAISVAEISDLTASAAELNQLDNTADLPDIRPSLMLDFANSKTLDPRITFTRGSTATYWDGKTTAKSEENLLPRSQEFDNGQWVTSGTVTANSTTAPDGTTTADTYAGNGVSGLQNITDYVADGGAISGTYAFSVYAKANTNNFIQFLYYGGTGLTYANFDLSTGAVGDYSGTSASITDVGNGWYRCEHVSTLASNTHVVIGLISSSTSSRAESWSTTNSVYLWGAQLEQRSAATAYTPTTSSPIVKYQPVLQTAASGEARFDHDPVTGESKGLLIEEARTNLVTYSEDFTNAAWAKTRSTIDSNISISPDGTITADKLVASTDNNSHRADFPYTASATTTYTFSVFAKAGEYTGVSLSPDQTSNTADDSAYFDLSSGTVTEGVNLDASSITDVGNGWFLCSATITTGASPANRALIGVLQDGSTSSYTGDGYSGVYIWGAQMEEGSFPTSYIPTSGSTVTRAKDDAKVTGSNFTDWYANTPISVYCDYSIDFSQPNSRLFSLDDGSYNNRMLIGIATSLQYGPFLENVVDNVGNVFQGASGITPTPAGSHKIAAALDFNDAAVTRDGGTLGVDSSCWVSPNINQLVIGAQANGANTMSGTIKKLAYYPKRLPNATLQAMTEV